jgi:ribosome recycling factor
MKKGRLPQIRSQIEQFEWDKKMTEDDQFNGPEQLQRVIDDYTKKIEEAAAAKEKASARFDSG